VDWSVERGAVAGMSDGQLIAASRATPEHFAAIFDRHAPAVHAYLARRIGRDADDLLAETFLVAFERRERYRTAVTDARPWLLGIATNLLRRRAREEVRLYRALARTGIDPVGGNAAPSPAERVAERVDASHAVRALAGTLADLPRRDRDALLLLAWGGLDYQEIARALGVPVGTVRSRLHRARSRLRGALEPLQPGVTEDRPWTS
jgi:RNA polymerase sigma factor (sigma-70 family)